MIRSFKSLSFKPLSKSMYMIMERHSRPASIFILFMFKRVLNSFLTYTASYYRNRKGGILIEFAFSIPILLILLFFAYDHYHFYELKSKIKASTYLAASMIQQLSNTKENKQLTKDDIGQITHASCLNFFHTASMFYPWPLGVFYSVDLYYVKKLSNDKYLYQHSYGSGQSGDSLSTIERCVESTQTFDPQQVKAIHNDLICNNEGDERILVTCCYRKANSFNKSKLGFFMINPTSTDKMDRVGTIFIYETVITPKPGLLLKSEVITNNNNN